MFDWDEGDRFSFEDSERFEEDSLCSWMSEPESVCNNWRGWKRISCNNNYSGHSAKGKDGQLLPLVELAAREVACHIPFEIVEHVYPPVPEQLQLRIAYWSFPENEEDIRLYSCLANGSADEFQRGENLLKARAVKDLLQIGFHLSATVVPPQSVGVSKGSYNVAVTFDRRRITSCNCTCISPASWCSHVVSVCLFRIHQSSQVRLRAPVSESLSRLHRDQLQKFAQYLISELPQQILPTAQRLLDELLSSQQTAINTLCGAPDPTAGASAHEQTTWCLDESQLHENIRKILIKLCVPSPIVFSDVNYLSSTAPPAAAEWSSLLRPLRGREPEGMWNLLSIVREMFRRSDRNAIPLLEILTEEVLACDQIILWWFNTKVSLHAGVNGHGNRGSIHSNTHASQHACSSLCDEIVILWRLAALNPTLSQHVSPQESKVFYNQLHDWHVKTLERVWKMRGNNGNGNNPNNIKRSDFDIFPGFKPAMEGCLMDWSDYPITGITYNSRWYKPSSHAHLAGPINVSTISCSNTDRVNSPSKCVPPVSRRPARSVDIGLGMQTLNISERTVTASPTHVASNASVPVISNSCDDNKSKSSKLLDSNRSSLSSEGFCETENEQLLDDTLNVQASTSGATPAPLNNSSKGNRMSTDTSSDSADVNADSNCSDSCAENLSSVKQNKVVVAPAAVDAAKAGNDQQGEEVIDEFQMYYYDGKVSKPGNAENNSAHGTQRRSNIASSLDSEERITVAVKKTEDPLEILFARAEALHAHGRTLEACYLAVKLAEEMLAHPPNLMIELPNPPARGKRGRRFNPACHQISLLASATLSKAAFLCSVLGENSDYHYLAFRVGLFGLEMARPPASTKPLEVKLANQEQDLVYLLKRIPLTAVKLQIVREKAEQLRDGKLRSRGEALLPLMLASYIFDALVLSPNQIQQSRPSSAAAPVGKLPTDEKLGFEAVVAALGLKANVSEAEHPLLCEGTRRQRGELAITLLVHYKDDQEKLSKIMDKLLDKEVHQMHKSPPGNGFANPFSPTTENKSPSTSDSTHSTAAKPANGPETVSAGVDEKENHSPNVPCAAESTANFNVPNRFERRDSASDPRQQANGRGGEIDRRDGASSPCWDEDYKAWEARFRCTNFRTNKKHSVGMASIDSSAPETTSSDNSPTVVRRTMWMRPGGPGSDSGSSGESSDSFASSSSGDKAVRAKARESDSPQLALAANRANPICPEVPPVAATPPRPGTLSVPVAPPVISAPTVTNIVSPAGPIMMTITAANMKQNRFKGKRIYPSVPNQPSEASAHFMFELAKTVLTKAGGNSSTAVLFTQPSAGQNHRGPHRALHMCAFQIGLYALGLHNAVSPNWLSRTYSSHVSWITGQAMEIGSLAINFLIDTWDGHLTPPEVASLADRASRGRDPAMVRAAAELALSCLPHAHALNPNEIQRALIQCKEQSGEMLERACLAVESAAKGGGVYPEVLFEVARKWFELYEESLHDRSQRNTSRSHNRNTENSDSGFASISIPHANSNFNAQSNAGSNSVVIPEAQHIIVQAQAERQSHLEGNHLMNIPPAMGNSATGPVTNPLPLQVLPALSCAPPGTYALPPHPSAHFPFGFYPGIPAFPQAAPMSIHPAYLSAAPTPAYPYQFHPNYPVTTTATVTVPHLRNAIAPIMFPNQALMPNVPVTQAGVTFTRAPILTISTQPQQLHALHQQPTFSITNTLGAMPVQAQQPLQQLNQRQLNYLLASYRVGMLAMDTLARRVHDDRPQAKYARNPSYGEDVKWLLGVAKKIGTSYLQEFCICTVNSVASPFVLHEIVIDTAQYLAHNNASGIAHSVRSHLLTPLIQKCQQMFIACTHFKMYHITPADYDEFVGIIRNARAAFTLTPGGMVQFNELLQSLRRSKSCKKDLWQHIASSLQTNI